MPEPALIAHVIDNWPGLYELLDFVVTPAIGDPSERGKWDFFFACNVPREYFGLRPGCQPGDIDVLVVPVRDGKLVAERAAAVEVKRLALKGPNWTKSVDRYGIRQATGLLAAGFPYVGLLHIVVSLDGPEEFHRPITYARIVDPLTGRYEVLGEGQEDLTSFFAAERQYRRLFAQEIDERIGINCVAIAETEKLGEPEWAYTTFTPGRRAIRNPRASKLLIENIQTLTEFWQETSQLRTADQRKLTRRDKYYSRVD
ncbi:hypothetical protein H7F51_01810 [Novosphingobium flavum]|uniref:Restriction endonuclease n=1 Tax=Novosphingobium flavum TaxID=1778672 RepID=A0A7X1FNX9_9SPHN|nr:hypothetical protein [Novosphingobium flavum]MBC2664248.1 hypothetical protein [Novosphingobium flavum]